MLIRNIAGQKIAVVALDVNNIPIDDAAANITAKISKDGAAPAATNDVNPAELSAADAPGVYLFDMTQAETDAGLIVLQAASTSSGVHFDAVIIHTDNQALATGAISAGTFANNAITAASIAAGAIGVTELADGAITAAKIANNAIGAAQIAADAIGASELAAAAVSEIIGAMNNVSATEVAAAVWDEALAAHIVSGSAAEALDAAALKTGYKLASDGVDLVIADASINIRQAISLILAVLAGKVSGAETSTVTIKGADTTTTRIVATVDSNGNRPATTLTPPA